MADSVESAQLALGIDIGGSGVKGAIVDLATGEFVGERHKIATPQPATPEAVAATCAEIVEHFEWTGAVGLTVPSVVKNQTALLAANIDPSWVGVDVQELFGRHLGTDREIAVLNDADAAGLAEVAYGDERATTGVVILLTFGTGIGAALLHHGQLFPNAELGHLVVDGSEAEHFASSAAKTREDLSYTEWSERVSRVLTEYENLFWPDLFIVGGGISRKSDKWVPKLTNRTPVLPAELRNRAGIVGAAMASAQGLKP